MLYKITHNLVAIDPNLYLVNNPSWIEEQYSGFDLTMDLYARLLVSSCLICKFLRKKLKILLAFAVMLLMCVSHDILLDNINRVTMLYKITHNLVAIDPNLYLVKQLIMHTRNSNILQYQLFNTRKCVSI
jgi:hypothetical protein